LIEGTRVLVVDDDPDIQSLLHDFLTLNGCEALSALNGKQALNLLGKNAIDIVILDVNLPDTDGVSLIDEIKKRDFRCSIVMMSGYNETNHIVNAMKKGAQDFLTKPLEFEKFLLTLLRVTGERRIHTGHNITQNNLEDKKKVEILNKELQKKIKELTMMYHISNKINSIKISEDFYERLVWIICETLETKYCAFYLLDRENMEAFLFKEAHTESSPYEKRDLLSGKDMLERLILFNKPMVKNNNLLMPFFIKGECIGIIAAQQPDNNDIETKKFLLRLILENSSTQIENRMLYESLFENVLQTLISLISTINMRDFYTEGHCKRVTEMSLAVAEKINMPEYEKDILRVACPIHDLGKVGIPDYILLKPDRLTDKEYELMKKHTVYGQDILSRFDILSNEAEIIKYHHERYDGKGYPNGITGEGIPLPARVIAVCDSFDAMTTDRPYRKAMSNNEALEEIKRCSGTQFDPEIVKGFEEVVKNGITGIAR